MQSGYGASEMHQQNHQLIDDDCSPSIFTISNPYNQPQQLQNLQQRKQLQQMFQQQQQQPLVPPFTPQLFHHQRQQQFQTFQQQQQQQQLGLQQQEPFFDVNFKLGLNENSENVMNQDDDRTLLQGNVSGIRQHSLVMPHSWNSQEDSAIKNPFWCNNKQCDEDKAPDIECNKNKKHYNHTLKQVDQRKERCKNIGTKYTQFSELEAVCNLANGKIFETSGSDLTGDKSPKDAGAVFLMSLRDMQCTNTCEMADADAELGSENSIEEACLGKVNENKKRKRKLKENYSGMIEFFKCLVQQLMDHQEGLHRKFLEAVHRMDKERAEREEKWRQQETEKHNREAIARAHEQSIASNREDQLISLIQKITGRSINLPPRKSALLLQPQLTKEQTKELTGMKGETNRWPKDEVEALIQVRIGLESRFLEPGLKGPLWEEVSSLMASMGYQRSAKRCKEKWENINKYFRKAKETGKKRSPRSKTCTYFDQLDQLYSRTPLNLPSSSSNPAFDSDIEQQNQGYSELLEAFAAERDHLGIAQNTSTAGNFDVFEMGSLRLNFDGIPNNQTIEFEQGRHGNENKDCVEEHKVDGEQQVE